MKGICGKRLLLPAIRLASAALLASAGARAQAPEQQVPVTFSEGKLSYRPDERGNRIPDFSYSGYMAGAQAIPDAPVKVVVPLKEGDATERIQAALDYVASLPAGENGIRGAVLLEEGNYLLEGSLRIDASGVVLRGSGMGSGGVTPGEAAPGNVMPGNVTPGEAASGNVTSGNVAPGGTVLTGAGTTRETLIRIAGKNDRETGPEVRITSPYVPVNAWEFQVSAGHSFREGDRVLVRRPSTEKWIADLRMEEFGGETGWLGWKPGERDIYWDRTITAVEGNTIVLDAPLTTALDTAYGGGTIAAYDWPGRIRQVGVENLTLRSTYDHGNPKDEAHRWMAITMENVCDAWVRQVVFRHFAGSAVAVYESGKRITVEDCKSLAPVSEIGGQRRYTFFTSGQQTLFQRLYAESGYHDFAAGFMAAGPNAFVQCESYRPYSFSGAVDSWASGLLFDNVRVDGQALSFLNRRQDAHGAGWTAANSVMWQCAAAKVNCFQPPTARNWAFGIWAAFAGNGYWGSVNDHVEPRSLYYAQLADRLGDPVTERAHLLPGYNGSTSSPTVEQAAELAAASYEPLLLLSEWIDRAPEREPIPEGKSIPEGLVAATAGSRIKTLEDIAGEANPAGERDPNPAGAGDTNPAGAGGSRLSMQLQNGWLVSDGAVLTGKTTGVRWWRGDARPYGAAEASPHITRFVPGRTGKGYTDDLAEVTRSMKAGHVLALEHNYGLWYDRRRDDHERVRRMTGDVWAPFYELPFARSGQDTAWDGLSKYDLTKYNSWYWSRLRDFAALATKERLVLIHQNYFQHNILEAGAHWADFPWRPANNINNTGFPEPPPYAGDKRIFMARQFYDTGHPVRRELHRAYIRKCLENFTPGSNVIQLTGAEFTGPLHFVRFWLETVQEWEEETGRQVFAGLSATKDVQDSILQDPRRAPAVDIIDIRYWHYRKDGSLYAPGGGQSLAPRQHARLVKPGREDFQQVYEAVRAYREAYPGKAVMYSAAGGSNYPWAVFMAGGSLAAIPEISAAGFLKAAATMNPVAAMKSAEGIPDRWVLQNAQGEQIIFDRSSGPLALDLAGISGSFRLHRIDPRTGKQLQEPETIKAGAPVHVKKKEAGPVVLWLSRDSPEEQDEVYLFSSFREPATEGLFLLYSRDGYHWKDLGGPFLKPLVGDSLMRDPSIVQGPDGTFHLVWTTAWRGDKGFGYASSRDLLHWSPQRFIPVMEHQDSTVNVWAPELFYDDEAGQFIIIWASTIPHRFPKGIEAEDNNHRMYYTLTKDFKTFSPAKLFLDPGFSVIDAVIVKRDKEDYVLVLKDNTRPNRNLKVAFATQPLGPYTNISEPFTGKLTEGPTVLRQDGQWLIYFDSYGDKTYKAVKTTDFKNFTDVSAVISLPEGHKHGTIFKTSEKLPDTLRPIK